MSKFQILINILDKLRSDAPAQFTSYSCPTGDINDINHARSKAYIHLYLKAGLGILTFEERESLITDGTGDGGIDAFYIDTQNKTILFIQSKFRTTEQNFEEKKIEIEEILKMDIDRILVGEKRDENNIAYNGKIIKMQRKISEIPDIAYYNYKVILLANVSAISESKLKILTSNIPVEVYNYKRTFSDLVFPIISGTFYCNSDLHISVNVSKEGGSSHISYNVHTSNGNCNITIVFVPLIEVGRVMHEYKNSILKYNPRSFLSMNEGTINNEIMHTVVSSNTNEFALYNNGITFISDQTNYNPRTGNKNQAKLAIKNPQIINGGQTAFTLSLAYEYYLNGNVDVLEKLQTKEVLVKIITFDDSIKVSDNDRLSLISSISDATNKQSFVSYADRSSNNPAFLESQKELFNNYGLLLERKKGEFFDGLRHEYIQKNHIISRERFMRIAFATLGYPVAPRKEKRLFSDERIGIILNDSSNYNKYFFGCLLYTELIGNSSHGFSPNSVPHAAYAIISVCFAKHYTEKSSQSHLYELAKIAILEVLQSWHKFENYVRDQYHNYSYFTFSLSTRTGEWTSFGKLTPYFKSSNVAMDLNDFFFLNNSQLIEEPHVRRKKLQIQDILYKKGITLSQLAIINSNFNPNDWYDQDTIEKISINYDLPQKIIRIGIGLLTSKETGFYLTKLIHTYLEQDEKMDQI